VVRRLPPTADAKELRSLIRDDEEGYVVRFENGFRMKIKGQRYIELHALLSGVSSRSIWEHLSSGQPLEELLSMILDEFGDWVRAERAQQLAQFDALNERLESVYGEVKTLPDRKSQALRIVAEHRDIASAVFAALDGKPTAPHLWKMIYPEFRRPSVAERIES
jgi:RNA ligase